MKSDQARLGVFDLLTQFTVGDKERSKGRTRQDRRGSAPGRSNSSSGSLGDHITFEKNTNYWRSGRPYLDGYQFTFYRDAQAMITSLESGALDYVSYPQISDALRLKNDPNYQVQAIFDAGANFAFWVTTTNPPFDRKEVRQAFNYAIDRQRIADTVLGGLAGPTKNLPWATYSPAFEAEKNNRYTYDLEKARSMLAAAGVTQLDTVMNYSGNSGRCPSSQAWPRSSSQIWRESASTSRLNRSTTLPGPTRP